MDRGSAISTLGENYWSDTFNYDDICSDRLTWADAVGLCNEHGFRMCTEDEVKDQIAYWYSCSSYVMWTSTECSGGASAAEASPLNVIVSENSASVCFDVTHWIMGMLATVAVLLALILWRMARSGASAPIRIYAPVDIDSEEC